MAYLEIVEGDNRGKTVRLPAEIVIGRTADNGLCLQDSSVSRQHAAILLRAIPTTSSAAEKAAHTTAAMSARQSATTTRALTWPSRVPLGQGMGSSSQMIPASCERNTPRLLAA